MDFRRYKFRSEWPVEVPPADAYTALRVISSYPKWWPEVRETNELSETRYELLCRSLLPYDLRFVIERSREDPEARVLEASMTGDLEGFSRWTITGDDHSSVCVFEEEVITNKRLLNLLAPALRPSFRFNHTLMMRHGHRGLQTFLAGMNLGRTSPRGTSEA
jgi:hypothetical protein